MKPEVQGRGAVGGGFTSRDFLGQQKGDGRMGTDGPGWLWLSLLATICVAPVFLIIPYFDRNFQVRPEVFMIWYFVGTSIGVAAWMGLSRRPAALLPNHPGVLLAILSVGLAFGAVANSSLFRAVVVAPNPGMPPAIYSAASVIVFLASALLAGRLPRYFQQVNTDPDRFLGILLVIAGLFLTAGGWPMVRGVFRN